MAKVLLLNCKHIRKTEDLERTGVTFDYGEILEFQGYFYTKIPEALYEYDLVVFDCDNIEQFSSGKMKEGYRPDNSFLKDLEGYYKKHGVLILIDGDKLDYILKSIDLGIYEIKPSRGNDKTYLSNEHPLASSIIKNMEKPVDSYIKLIEPRVEDRKNFIKKIEDFKWFLQMENKNKDFVALSLSAKDSVNDFETIFMLPKLKFLKPVIKKILEYIANRSENLFTEYKTIDWLVGEKYLPEKIKSLIGEIKKNQKEYETRDDILRKEIQSENAKFKLLQGLLTFQNDELKVLVKQCLEGVLELEVKDKDEENKSLKKEDLEFVYEGNTYILEVKGISASNPSPIYLTQVVTNARKREKKGDYEGKLVPMFIINHDIKNDPSSRAHSYQDEESKEILSENDIILVETLDLFYLLKDVYDGKRDCNNAKKELLKSAGERYIFKKEKLPE